ncbi:fibronectin type III domain-containing protein [Paenibacillus sp. UNC451MF]|uniref:fibronectin type III domain-containing protein n=1 Tax=Paenibacillus sp. UNC451MF TaxID=1449063 RepID=UPI000690DAAF|nr:fibronectin type III domain-containing protein [Paenibacillus sp. UNC451MF]
MKLTKESSWGFKDPRELHLAAQLPAEQPFSALHITRLAPGSACLEMDWNHFDCSSSCSASYRVHYRLRDSGPFVQFNVTGPMGTTKIQGLEDGQDYEIYVSALQNGESLPTIQSPVRLFRPGEVPGTVVNYIHPDDYTYGFSGRSPASPSIVRLPNEDLLASHDVYWGNEGQNLSLLYRSSDNGYTWSFVTFLYPCFWGKLFVHQERLYMLATSTEYGALLIGRSDNGGETWSQPTVLIEAGSREAGGPHKAPMPVTEHNGRLWTAIDYGSWTTGSHASGLISVPVDADLLDSANWTKMPFLPYNKDWPGTVMGGKRSGLLEGNAVVLPSGKLVNLLRYQTNGGTPDHGRAIMLVADADHPELPLKFGKVIDFYGNLSKFTIYYDSESGKYWSLVNRVNPPTTGQRNILTLVSSADLEHWEIVKDVLDYEHNGWPEDSKKVGFQYVDWIFRGSDIYFLSRTAINGAYNYHNANYITFHRLEQFRRLECTDQA